MPMSISKQDWHRFRASKIDLSGATPMEWVLEYDSEQLRRLGITLSDIQQAVSRYYLKEFLGTYNVESSTGGKEWIRLALMPETKDEGFDVSRIRVKSAEGKLISLDELVTDFIAQCRGDFSGLGGKRINHIHQHQCRKERQWFQQCFRYFLF